MNDNKAQAASHPTPEPTPFAGDITRATLEQALAIELLNLDADDLADDDTPRRARIRQYATEWLALDDAEVNNADM